MTYKTIIISEETYKGLLTLKQNFNMSFSDVINELIKLSEPHLIDVSKKPFTRWDKVLKITNNPSDMLSFEDIKTCIERMPQYTVNREDLKHYLCDKHHLEFKPHYDIKGVSRKFIGVKLLLDWNLLE